MRNRHFRRVARTSVLGTAALLTALTLTACQEDGSAAVGTSTPAPAASPEQPADSSKAPSEDQGKGTNGAAAGSGSTDAEPAAQKPKETGTDADNGGDDGPVTLACDGGNTKVTLTAVPRPVNHMLLTVTNSGSKACNAYSYPFLKFGEAQSAPQAFEESKPQAVVTLSPGQSAYSAVMTSSADGSGTDGYSAEDLTVSFQGREGSGSSGPSATVPLSKPVYVDSTLKVTYWQTDMADALAY
ncbi:DUF4232 domain-containing protein [Streptomyces sp. NPDC058637]|uniref:DUF4232 domain-containing protein n=1 Tax=Streptomyces sp. NPDC058637 TaxID=3346569 RepID=UPI00365101AB